MLQRFKSVPNLLSALRLLLIPILWVLALLKLELALGVFLAVAFTTDALDGFVARRFNLSTHFGSKLDSLADTLLQLSAWVWLLLLQPEVAGQHAALFWGASLLMLISICLGLVKFRGLPNLHLYSSKLAGLFYAIFMVSTFVFEGYNLILFYLTILFGVIAALETTSLQIISKKTNENMGSLFLTFLRRSKAAE